MSLVQFRPEAPSRRQSPLKIGIAYFHVNTLSADLAHLVERDLAKVEVAGSSPVIRSIKIPTTHSGGRYFYAAAYGREQPPGGEAAGRNRTTDTRIFSPLLYRLSYRGLKFGGTDGNRTRDLRRDRPAC